MLQYATKQGPGSLCWCIWLLNKQNKKTSIICPLWRKYRNHSLNGNMETHTWSLDMQSFFLRLTKIQRIRNRSGLQIQLVSRSPEGSASTHYSTTHSVHFTKSLDPLCKIITSIVDACMKKRKVKSTTYVLDRSNDSCLGFDVSVEILVSTGYFLVHWVSLKENNYISHLA